MNNHGGKRKGAGRHKKPDSDKKKLMRLYVKQSDIDLLGGYDILQENIYLIIEEMLTKKSDQ